MRKSLTKPQAKALAFLRENIDRLPRNQNGGFLTGINTNVLESLKKKGLIRTRSNDEMGDGIYLGGLVYNLELGDEHENDG